MPTRISCQNRRERNSTAGAESRSCLCGRRADAVDHRDLFRRELTVADSGDVLNHLLGATGAYQRGRELRMTQYPAKCHLRQSLAARKREFVQLTDLRQTLRSDLRGLQRAGRLGRSRAGRDAIEILVRQHTLGKWRESNDPDAQLT